VRTLVDFANSRGGPDNVTVQIARIPGQKADGASDSEGPQPSARGLILTLVGLAVLLSAIVVWSMFGELRDATREAGAARETPVEAD
jgi:hypothetical protein